MFFFSLEYIKPMLSILSIIFQYSSNFLKWKLTKSYIFEVKLTKSYNKILYNKINKN